MSMLHNASEHEALHLEASKVSEGKPTPPKSPAPSDTAGKTPTTGNRLVDLAATVDAGPAEPVGQVGQFPDQYFHRILLLFIFLLPHPQMWAGKCGRVNHCNQY